jgi:hypothetical protein
VNEVEMGSDSCKYRLPATPMSFNIVSPVKRNLIEFDRLSEKVIMNLSDWANRPISPTRISMSRSGIRNVDY